MHVVRGILGKDDRYDLLEDSLDYAKALEDPMPSISSSSPNKEETQVISTSDGSIKVVKKFHNNSYTEGGTKKPVQKVVMNPIPVDSTIDDSGDESECIEALKTLDEASNYLKSEASEEEVEEKKTIKCYSPITTVNGNGKNGSEEELCIVESTDETGSENEEEGQQVEKVVRNPFFPATTVAKKKKKKNKPKKKKFRVQKRRNSFNDPMPIEFRHDFTLKKYWYQRYNLFSRFDEGIKLDRGEFFFIQLLI